MPRASREQRALNHERVVERASQLVRERGSGGVSVSELMAAAGLTQGGFYKHFSSKDELLARATEAAFDDRLRSLAGLIESADSPEAARSAFLSEYLSTGHRDSPAHGCAAVALAGDAGRRDEGDPLRRSYIAGLRAMVDALEALDDPLGSAEPGDVAGETDAPSRALADLATLVGAVILARATAGDDISEHILTAARQSLTNS